MGLDIINWPEQAKWNPVVVSIYRYLPFAITHEWQFLHNHFPNDISINYNFGLWSLNIKDYKQAAAQLGTAVESQQLPEPVRGTAYKNLGFALFESGGVTKAEAPLRAALEQSPPDFRAYCLLSYVYKHTGRLEEATRAEANCIKLVPSEKLTQ